jgi:hypothetical protein
LLLLGNNSFDAKRQHRPRWELFSVPAWKSVRYRIALIAGSATAGVEGVSVPVWASSAGSGFWQQLPFVF